MNMQSFLKSLPLALVMLCGNTVLAELAPARLLYNDGSHDDALVISYSAGTATYKSNEKSLNILRVSKPKLGSVYFYKPKVFSEAMSLYHARNYQEAKVKFAECEIAYKAVDSLPNNYASLAGFYKMECSRRMFDLAALSSELEKYRKNGLTRENHLQQLEVYTFWEAVRLKDWERLDRLAVSWQERKVPASLRIQIEYCHALALDQMAQKDPNRTIDALNAYSRAMIADGTTSIEMVLEAANNALRIYANDPGVKLAVKLWKTEDENRNTVGYQRLMEAASLVSFYQQAGFDQLKPLEPECQKFLNYSPPKTETAALKVEEKPKEGQKPKEDDEAKEDVEPEEKEAEGAKDAKKLRR